LDRLKAFFAGHWQLLALMVVVFALWPTPVVAPLKLLVVYLHELSHGLAAILTGGSIEQLNASPQMGGFAVTRGGSRFAILTAGYLGSLVFGVALLLAALRSEADRYVTAGLGAVTLLVTGRAHAGRRDWGHHDDVGWAVVGHQPACDCLGAALCPWPIQ